MTSPQPSDENWTPPLTFAAKLALIRHSKGWNLKQAALACGFPPQSWRGWEIQGRLPHDIRAVARRIEMRTGLAKGWLLADEVMADQEPTTVTNYGERVIAVAGEAREARSPYRGRPVHRTRPVRTALLTRS